MSKVTFVIKFSIDDDISADHSVRFFWQMLRHMQHLGSINSSRVLRFSSPLLTNPEFEWLEDLSSIPEPEGLGDPEENNVYFDEKEQKDMVRGCSESKS